MKCVCTKLITSSLEGMSVDFHFLVRRSFMARRMCMVTSLRCGGNSSMVKLRIANCGVSVIG